MKYSCITQKAHKWAFASVIASQRQEHFCRMTVNERVFTKAQIKI